MNTEQKIHQNFEENWRETVTVFCAAKYYRYRWHAGKLEAQNSARWNSAAFKPLLEQFTADSSL